MTQRLRAADRDRMLKTAIGRLVALREYGVNRAHRELDQARDGMHGTDYDAIRSSGEASTSPTERAALDPDGITPDQLDTALVTLETVCVTLGLGWTPPAKSNARPKPGRGPCPSKHCVDHWEAGISLKAATSRYTDYCRRCGDHRGTYKQSIPTPVLQAAYATRGRTRDGREDWQHWSVLRAWAACGGKPTMEAEPGEPTEPDALTSPGAA